MHYSFYDISNQIKIITYQRARKPSDTENRCPIRVLNVYIKQRTTVLRVQNTDDPIITRDIYYLTY